MIGDYHVHTKFSSDCNSEPEDLIKKAISLGMNEICFTDHVDFDYPPENGQTIFRINTKEYFNTLAALRDSYKNRIKIKIGIELGLNPSIEEMNSSFVKSNDFDFVIGVAEELDIPFQYTVIARGGTDAGSQHVTRNGMPALAITVATRYLHSHTSVIHEDDYLNTVKLVTEVVRRLDVEAVKELLSY